MKLHFPKSLLPHFDSESLHEDGDVVFEPFSIVKIRAIVDNLYLVIGYRKDKSVVVIPDQQISFLRSDIEAFHAEEEGIEATKADRKSAFSDSIFRKPKTGDTVMCVAKDRYVGAVFGETYKVKTTEINKGNVRIGFDTGTGFTYEAKYFIVVKSREVLSDKIIIGHTHHLKNSAQYEIGHNSDSHNITIGNSALPKIHIHGGNGFDFPSSIKNRYKNPNNKHFSDSDNEDEILSRPRVSDYGLSKRKLYNSELISKSK